MKDTVGKPHPAGTAGKGGKEGGKKITPKNNPRKVKGPGKGAGEVKYP